MAGARKTVTVQQIVLLGLFLHVLHPHDKIDKIIQ